MVILTLDGRIIGISCSHLGCDGKLKSEKQADIRTYAALSGGHVWGAIVHMSTPHTFLVEILIDNGTLGGLFG